MKKIVIIGGGYAGIYALRQLVKNKNIHITLIDKHTYHNLQPEVYDFIANQSTIADVTIDLSTLCTGFSHPNLEFKNLRVIDIDHHNNLIKTEEHESINFDYLLIAIGGRTLFPKSITGLNNTEDIKKLHKALYFKQNFEKQLFTKIEDETKKCDKTHIVVVGAGLSGVEIAAEMAYYAKKFFQRGSFACDHLQITLISSRDTILPGFDNKIIQMSQKRLEQLDIDIITNTKMSSSDKEYLYLSDGTKIQYSFIVFAGGVEAANLALNTNFEKNGKGQFIVDKYLRIKGFKNIFAIGDVAEICDANNKTMPSNVTVARFSGNTAAKNIINDIDNKPLLDCNPKIDGTLIALGGKYAVCDLYGIIKLDGFIAYLIKQYVFFIYKLPLLKYIKLGYHKFKNCNVTIID